MSKKVRSQNHYLVGIGASAGGLESLQLFFQNLSQTRDFSFIVVQHLSPDHETMMPELLSKYTPLPVQQVSDNMLVKPGHVYVIPPNATLTINNLILRIKKPFEQRGFRTPIDSFFISLAQDLGEKAICIVMSGTGSDGTIGLKAIKEGGGLTIAQSPNSAKYDSMPRNAIASGMVDYELPAEEIPKALKDYITHFGKTISGHTPLAAEAAAHLKQICNLLRAKTGHDFSDYKQSTLIRRIQRRMALQKLSLGKEYLDFLQQNETEINSLFEDFLIGVTFFFRDPSVFKKIENEIVPSIYEQTKKQGFNHKIRIWVVGCATGEESYSLAIIFKEYIERHNIRAEVQIFATDLDENAIERARKAKYSEGIAEHISAERLDRFFLKSDHSYIVRKEIREMCLFSTHNVLRDPPFAHIDLLSCRNMLIYLDTNLQKKIIPIFNYALKENGYLVLGSAENISGFYEGFTELDRQLKIWRCKKVLPRPPVLFTSDYRPKNPKPLLITHEIQIPKRKDVADEVRKIIVDKIAPPSVVVNKDLDVIFVIGEIENYLRLATGSMTANLFQLAKHNLKYDLRTALSKASKSKGHLSRFDAASVGSGNNRRQVRIEIRKLYEAEVGEDLFLVSFFELRLSEENLSPKSRGDNQNSGIIELLEMELKQTKIHLQSILEEAESARQDLTSSNEELLSMNEELQSTNEELQTSQEELQSVNEELETVNAELHLKLEELDGANSDLQNLLTSIRIATFFLDENKCIKRYTPETKQILNILDSDVGRPITDIAGGVFPFDIQKEIDSVLEKLLPFEQEFILDRTQKSYLVRILPYRSVVNVIAGVVITLSDISKVKEAEAHLRLTKERLDAALKGGKCGYFDIKFDPKSNEYSEDNFDSDKFFAETFHSDEMLALIGFRSGELRNVRQEWLQRIHPEDIDYVRTQVLNHINHATSDFSIEYRVRHRKGHYVWLVTQDKIIRSQSGKPWRWAGLVFDITERKNSEEAKAHLAALVESSQIAILSKSLDGTIKSWNKGAENLYGYSRNEVIGKSIEIIIPEGLRSKLTPLYERLAKGEAIAPFETERVRKDGQKVHILLTLSPILIAGKVVGVSAMSQDLTAQKTAEEESRQSQSNFKALFNFMPMACFLIENFRGTISDGNEEFLNMFGATKKEELLGKTQWDLSPDYQEHVGKSSRDYGEELIQTLESEGLVRFEWIHETLSGNPFLADVLVRKYFMGGVGHYLCILRDITLEKRAEENLRKSEETIRTIAENSTQALVLMNEHGICTYCNKAWLDMTGFTMEEIKARPLHDIVHHHYPDGRPYPMKDCPIDRALPENFYVRSHEDFFFRKNGEIFPVICAASPIFENGKPVSTVLEVRDVSQLKLYEQEIRESEERLRLAAKATRFGTYDLNIAEKTAVWSPELSKILGIDGQNGDLQKIMIKIIIPEDRERYLVNVRDLISDNGSDRWDIQYRIRLKDGEIRWIHDMANKVLHEDRRTQRKVRIVGTIQDITGQKTYEYRLIEADEKKNQFLAMLAHELRNPLVPLRFGLDLLKSEKIDKIEETRRTMERQTEHLIRLVDDLLDISRISQGKLQLVKSHCDLKQIIDDAVTGTRHHFESKRQKVNVSLPDESIHLNADPHRLMQVISNLLVNASKYSPQKGNVQLEASKQHATLTIAVKDNGIGIPPDKLESIFEMFSQVDQHQKKAEGGLGIGLTLVKSLIQMHDGSIEAFSNGAGKGSEFRIILPCLTEMPTSVEPPATLDRGHTNKRRLRVLVVDDNLDVLTLTRIYVERLGHEVQTATNGREAISLARDYLPNAVLFDLNMPEMDGYEAATLIRKESWGKGITLIALTGHGRNEDIRRSEDVGFDHHLIKPVKPSVLESLLSNVGSKTENIH